MLTRPAGACNARARLGAAVSAAGMHAEEGKFLLFLGGSHFADALRLEYL